MSEHSLPTESLSPLFISDGTVSTSETLLEQFLLSTTNLDLEDSERLRRLAINLEYEELVDGWSSLYFVYESSLAKNPENVKTYHSVAISAIEWMQEDRTNNIEDRRSIADTAQARILEAIDKCPEDGELNYTFGLVFYNHPGRIRDKDTEYTELALEQFDKALRNNSDHQMAALYRAHCLHDSEQWERAYQAYSEVNRAKLVEQHPYWKWRSLKLQE